MEDNRDLNPTMGVSNGEMSRLDLSGRNIDYDAPPPPWDRDSS